MSDCPHINDAEMWLDGEAGPRADAIARHIAVCTTCKAHVETLRRLDFAARESAIRVKAPEGLVARLDDVDVARPAQQRQPVSRRWVLSGAAAAAAVAAIGSVVWQGRTRRDGNDFSLAVFGDFLTHLDADRDLDLVETNPQRVVDWFAPKVPFPMPRLASLSELELVGGRLCWLLDRRIAAFNFNRNGEALGLYVAEASGLTCQDTALPGIDLAPLLVSQNDLNGAFWREGDLALALVGQPASEVVADLADLLHS